VVFMNYVCFYELLTLMYFYIYRQFCVLTNSFKLKFCMGYISNNMFQKLIPQNLRSSRYIKLDWNWILVFSSLKWGLRYWLLGNVDGLRGFLMFSRHAKTWKVRIMNEYVTCMSPCFQFYCHLYIFRYRNPSYYKIIHKHKYKNIH
jgi:hypothetical protein